MIGPCLNVKKVVTRAGPIRVVGAVAGMGAQGLRQAGHSRRLSLIFVEKLTPNKIMPNLNVATLRVGASAKLEMVPRHSIVSGGNNEVFNTWGA